MNEINSWNSCFKSSGMLGLRVCNELCDMIAIDVIQIGSNCKESPITDNGTSSAQVDSVSP